MINMNDICIFLLFFVFQLLAQGNPFFLTFVLLQNAFILLKFYA